MKLELNYVYNYYADEWDEDASTIVIVISKEEDKLFKKIRYRLKQLKEPYSMLEFFIYEDRVNEKNFKVNTIETLKWKNGKSNSKKR